MIDRTDDDVVASIRMCHEPANVLATDFSDALWAALTEARDDDSVRAVVLTGTGSAFSAGVDLFRVVEEGADYVEQLLASLDTLFAGLWTYPKPLIAAVNGHAIAGGGVMACACDYRIGVEGSAKIGLPELLVGVPFPAVALRVVRNAIPVRYQREVILLGRTYGVEDAAERGFIDEVVEPDALLPRAKEVAGELATIPPDTYAFSKRQLTRAARHGALSELEDDLGDLWRSPAIHGHIRGYMEATLGKDSL
ncbi:MAG: enoyl-CoA hydratase/isomerase family protein [Gemmatimonadetes bacterium]|nr:enoyl-CoA hydratase/isomerase family protein [Gemmatimonadota bacterium]